MAAAESARQILARHPEVTGVFAAICNGAQTDAIGTTTTGEVRGFTIVSLAAPGIPTPFVAAVIDCEGTSVRANVINTPPDPEHVQLGMKVRLATQVVGTDSAEYIDSKARPRTLALRWYAGQCDPSDDSHFTINFQLDGKPGVLDGWLRNDDTIRLQLRASAPTP